MLSHLYLCLNIGISIAICPKNLVLDGQALVFNHYGISVVLAYHYIILCKTMMKPWISQTSLLFPFLQGSM